MRVLVPPSHCSVGAGHGIGGPGVGLAAEHAKDERVCRWTALTLVNERSPLQSGDGADGGNGARHLVDGAVSLLRAEDRVFEAMVNGWRAQQLARGLTTQSIRAAAAVVSRFQENTNEYPWKWTAHHVDEFLADRRGGDKPIAARSRTPATLA
jgi:hypothetical protein